MEFSIGEFSNMTGMSIHTLRYYEKEKLITPARQDNGRRSYSENDVRWIQFIKRLKATNMPIKEIRKYADLRAKGDSTLVERLEMLTKHRTALKDEITKLNEHLENLDNKIAYYRNEIDKSQQKVGSNEQNAKSGTVGP
jgi:DNA-binding transcriptional MerR regulator